MTEANIKTNWLLTSYWITQCLFIVLNWAGKVSWPWLWVFSPTWAAMIISNLLAILGYIINSKKKLETQSEK